MFPVSSDLGVSPEKWLVINWLKHTTGKTNIVVPRDCIITVMNDKEKTELALIAISTGRDESTFSMYNSRLATAVDDLAKEGENVAMTVMISKTEHLVMAIVKDKKCLPWDWDIFAKCRKHVLFDIQRTPRRGDDKENHPHDAYCNKIKTQLAPESSSEEEESDDSDDSE
jgi:hypothetical protein